MRGDEDGPGQPAALIIAAGQYEDQGLSQLRAPPRDADDLAAVLSDPAIGDFAAEVRVDAPAHLLREEIEGFFAERLP